MLDNELKVIILPALLEQDLQLKRENLKLSEDQVKKQRYQLISDSKTKGVVRNEMKLKSEL